MFEISVNNGRIMRVEHDEKREIVIVKTLESNGEIANMQCIPDEEFVMLLNLEMFYQTNDIRSAFINPDGSYTAAEFDV